MCRLIKITRYFRKIESEDERTANEREWTRVFGTATAKDKDTDDDDQPIPEPSTSMRLLILLIVVLAVWAPEIYIGLGVTLLIGLAGSGALLRRYIKTADSSWTRAEKSQIEERRARREARQTLPTWSVSGSLHQPLMTY